VLSGGFLSAGATLNHPAQSDEASELQPGSYGVRGGAASPLPIPVSPLPGTLLSLSVEPARRMDG